ncbi:MAG TPA: nuclear transport factor 2 family protein [Polyangiaceae bacterium]
MRASTSVHLVPLAAIVCLGGSACASSPGAPATAPTASLSPVAGCVVWDREVAFARSVQDHDAHAFAGFVHPNAVFIDNDGTLTRGRDAVVESWKGLVSGETVRLGWHPTTVVLTGDGHTALSRGPYWVEIAKPGAPRRLLVGTFQSVWVLDADGTWRVAIDGGTAAGSATTDEELQKIKAAIPARCPG